MLNLLGLREIPKHGPSERGSGEVRGCCISVQELHDLAGKHTAFNLLDTASKIL